MSRNRNYDVKDTEMIVAADVICENAIAQLDTLTQYDTGLTPDYINTLKTDINTAANTILGADNAKALRAATAEVMNIFTDAAKALQAMKELISIKYANDKHRLEEIMTTLGYKAYSHLVRVHDQEALIEHLFRYRDNITELTGELTTLNIPIARINAPKAFAKDMRDANVNQEVLKGARKQLTETQIIALNEIYAKVMSICKIGRLAFKGDGVKQKLFSFSYITDTLNHHPAPLGTSVSDS